MRQKHINFLERSNKHISSILVTKNCGNMWNMFIILVGKMSPVWFILLFIFLLREHWTDYLHSLWEFSTKALQSLDSTHWTNKYYYNVTRILTALQRVCHKLNFKLNSNLHCFNSTFKAQVLSVKLIYITASQSSML